MSHLRTFVDSPVAGAIGWTLLHSLWEGAVISGALAAVVAAVRSPRVRYAAACAAMLMILVGFGITFLYLMPEGAHAASRPHSGVQIWNPGGNPLSRSGIPTAIVPWVAPLWIAGVSLIYLRRAAEWLVVRKLRTRGVCSPPARWQNEVARLSRRLRISRPILLLESSLADVPVVLGHFRPLILMPVGLLTGLPPEQIEAILLHELAHIRRDDYLVNVLQRLIEGLFFYHPAIWWISRVMGSEREHCCDDVAVFIGGNAHEYASALAAIEGRRHVVVEPAVAATGGSIAKRIRRLLYPAKPNGAWAPFLAATVFITLAAVSVTAWQSVPQPRQSLAIVVPPLAERPAPPAAQAPGSEPSVAADAVESAPVDMAPEPAPAEEPLHEQLVEEPIVAAPIAPPPPAPPPEPAAPHVAPPAAPTKPAPYPPHIPGPAIR